MLIDARDASAGPAFTTDVCVIGAGAAGIPIALALAAAGRDACLVESGGVEPSSETHALNEGTVAGASYDLASSRVRALGGSTHHWGGLCRPLDATDFDVQPGLPESGWPLRRSELDPFYEGAFGVLDIPRFFRSLEDIEPDPGRAPRLLGASDAIEPVVWWKSPPTQLGKKHHAAIAGSARLRCVLHATVVRLGATRDATAVTTAHARTLGGRALTIDARHFVLCAGGIETPRLLLLSNDVVADGLGNQHDLVGRYFMDHPNRTLARVAVSPPAGVREVLEERILRRAQAGLSGVWDRSIGLATTPAWRARHRLAGSALHLLPITGAPPPPAIAAILRRGDADRPVRWYDVSVVSEQRPNRESRVLLGDERDPLGARRAVLRLDVSAADRRAMHKVVRRFARDVARAGHGRVQLLPVTNERWFELPGHHIGTARMADDPRRGVTDRYGRVHGLANLHVAGSALFPTGGYANPTLTIVALALRLADRLKTIG